MTKRKRLHIFYSGRVQGVGFRYETKETAQRLGLVDWVRNRRDGRVETVVEGNEQTLKSFLVALQSGPLGLNIRHAETSWHDATGEFSSFTIRTTE